MFVARREASVTNLSPMALGATALGTFSTLFMVPIERSDVPGAVTVTIQLVGLAMATVAMGSLRRSFGLAPANRGVKTAGMYRYVRHRSRRISSPSQATCSLSRPETSWCLPVPSPATAQRNKLEDGSP